MHAQFGLAHATRLANSAAAFGTVLAGTPPSQGKVTSSDPLDSIGSVMSVRRNAEIYAEGAPAEHWYKVVSGAVRACKLLADGRRQITEFLLPGDYFGFEPASERLCAAEAVTDVVLVRYARRSVDSMADRDVALARRLRDLSYRKLAAAHTHLVTLGRKTAQERIAAFLVEMAERTTGDGGEVMLPMSRYDIADHLGLTVETVSRTLTQLKRDGLIALPAPHAVALTDREGLQTLSEA